MSDNKQPIMSTNNAPQDNIGSSLPNVLQVNSQKIALKAQEGNHM